MGPLLVLDVDLVELVDLASFMVHQVLQQLRLRRSFPFAESNAAAAFEVAVVHSESVIPRTRAKSCRKLEDGADAIPYERVLTAVPSG